MTRTRIQRCQENTHEEYWVVYIVPESPPSCHTLTYIRPSGLMGNKYKYSTEEEAQTARSSFYKRYPVQESEIKMEAPADLKAGRTCADCVRQACDKKEFQPAYSCTRFVPNLSPEGKILSSKRYPEDGEKESNPKYSEGCKKASLHCIPCGPLFELGLAMFEGSRKYGRHNYRAVGGRASTYYDAAIGHIMDWWEGEEIDPDSGVHHLIKAMACLLVVRDSMLMGNFNDDRPLRYPEKHGRSDFNIQVKEIVEKYPNCTEPFLETGKSISGDKPKEKLVVCNSIAGKCPAHCFHAEPHEKLASCDWYCQTADIVVNCKEVK